MYESDVFKPASFTINLPIEPIRQLIGLAQSLMSPRDCANRAQALHDVLRLNVISAAGATPAAYGWHVDALLNVRMQSAHEPLRTAAEPSTDDDEPTPPDKGVKVRAYHVPRTRQAAALNLQGRLAGNAA